MSSVVILTETTGTLIPSLIEVTPSGIIVDGVPFAYALSADAGVTVRSTPTGISEVTITLFAEAVEIRGA